MLPADEIINKTMERGDLDSAGAKAIIAELNALIRELKDQKIEISSWYGKLAGEKDAFERINRYERGLPGSQGGLRYGARSHDRNRRPEQKTGVQRLH